MKRHSRLALLLNEAGLTVYGNKAGLVSLAERLLRIAEANPDECYEVHVRMAFESRFDDVRGDVTPIVYEELQPYYASLPENAGPDAEPVGFELTFMHIGEQGLDQLRESSSAAPA